MNSMHTKGTVFAEIKTELLEQGFTIVQEDTERPWGGFFVIDEAQAQAFANTYFDGLDVNDLKISGKLSPKILLVAPGTRLSWQYHHRRAEIWRLIKGTAVLCTSFTDVEGPVKTLLWTNFIICKKVFMFSSGIVQNDISRMLENGEMTINDLIASRPWPSLVSP